MTSVQVGKLCVPGWVESAGFGAGGGSENHTPALRTRRGVGATFKCCWDTLKYPWTSDAVGIQEGGGGRGGGVLDSDEEGAAAEDLSGSYAIPRRENLTVRTSTEGRMQGREEVGQRDRGRQTVWKFPGVCDAADAAFTEVTSRGHGPPRSAVLEWLTPECYCQKPNSPRDCHRRSSVPAHRHVTPCHPHFMPFPPTPAHMCCLMGNCPQPVSRAQRPRHCRPRP